MFKKPTEYQIYFGCWSVLLFISGFMFLAVLFDVLFNIQ